MKKTLRKMLVALLFGVLATVSSYLRWFSDAELLAKDHLYQKTNPADPRIKIIAIDKKTTDLLGAEASWSRSVYSTLINRLYYEDCRPAVLAFYLPFYGEQDHAGDQSLVNACLKASNVVVPSRIESNTLSLSVNSSNKVLTRFLGLTNAYGSLPLYTRSGFSNLLLDTDGYVRYYLPDIVGDFGHIDSFAASVFQAYHKATGNYLSHSDGIERVFIDYVGGSGSFDTYSFWDVYTGSVDASEFADCILLVGNTSEDTNDAYNVPIQRGTQMYGVEIQANILQSILSGDAIVDGNNVVASLVFGLLITLFLFIVLDKSIFLGSVFYLVFAGMFFFICQSMLTWGQILPVIYFPFTLLLSYIYFLLNKSGLERAQKAAEMQELLYSMAEAMTEAVDAKTPYNATHTRNVVRYCLELADRVRSRNRNPRSRYHLSANDVDQLHMAALLHDVGKLDIPSRILDKSDRLGYRADALWEKWERLQLLYRLALAEHHITDAQYREEVDFLQQTKSNIQTISTKEYLSDEDLSFIETIANKTFSALPAMEPIPYLSTDEITALSIRRGTLTKEELDTTHFHVCYTEQILELVKFGHEFNHVFDIARHHHEFLNGSGYPFGLREDAIDIPTRILTICDIYDALTADDRPYKKAKTREQTFEILKKMAANGELDSYLVNLAEELWSEEALSPVNEADAPINDEE